MLTAIIVTLIIVASLGYALRPQRRNSPPVHRPYRNRYNDAAGAREDHLG